MSSRPNFKLSRLREIGWSQWDPIGLGGTPDDEYDSYLLQAAGRLSSGASEEEVTDYLVGIETEYMGLDDGQGARSRAHDVVEALNDYLAELRG